MQNRKKDVTWRKPAIGGAVAGAIAMTIVLRPGYETPGCASSGCQL